MRANQAQARLDAVAAALAPEQSWWTPEQFDAEAALIAACLPTPARTPVIKWGYDGRQFVIVDRGHYTPAQPPVIDCPDCTAYVSELMDSGGYGPAPSEPACWGQH